MHRTRIQSSIVADAVAIIAAGTSSRAIAELAIALRMVHHEHTELPPGLMHDDDKARIERNVSNVLWQFDAWSAMHDPDVKELARLFCTIFVQRVPATSANPLMDSEWLAGARALFLGEPRLHVMATALLGQIRITKGRYETPPEEETSKSAQPVQQSHIAHQQLREKAQIVADAFMKYYEAKKARETALPMPAPNSQLSPPASVISTPVDTSKPTAKPVAAGLQKVFVQARANRTRRRRVLSKRSRIFLLVRHLATSLSTNLTASRRYRMDELPRRRRSMDSPAAHSRKFSTVLIE